MHATLKLTRRDGILHYLWSLDLSKSFSKFKAVVRRCSSKIGILINFASFTGKQLCWILFFNKVASLQAYNFIKKTSTQVSSCEIWEIFKSIFSTEHLLWLLPSIDRVNICLFAHIVFCFVFFCTSLIEKIPLGLVLLLHKK